MSISARRLSRWSIWWAICICFTVQFSHCGTAGRCRNICSCRSCCSLLPILAGSILQYLFYGLAFLWVSTALGLTSLHINLQNERFFLDPLTNLYSRAYLIRYLGALPERRKTKQVTGLMLDVNHFKHINDHYGHLEGDLVLREVGSLLQRASGSHAMVARYGGDEFVILLEDAQEERDGGPVPPD